LDILRWTDRVYGEVAIDDPEVLALIATPTFKRLRGIRQAGPSAITHAFKTVTRSEHSVGVYLLLGRLGANRRERVAGLLHDISHTAFSHAVDFVFDSEEQDYHESLKPQFIERPDIVAALCRMGFSPGDFHDDSIYPLLERPLPWLCADRVDYFLRDSLACAVSTPESVARTLRHLAVVDELLMLTDIDVARDVVARFAEMNSEWWASPVESYIYNEFADALREGLRIGALLPESFLGTDIDVLRSLRSAGNALIDEKLERIRRVEPSDLVGFVPKVIPKVRWLDPPVLQGSSWKRLSEIAPIPAASFRA
jgi:HD superfamily phosphohydrolase